MFITSYFHFLSSFTPNYKTLKFLKETRLSETEIEQKSLREGQRRIALAKKPHFPAPCRFVRKTFCFYLKGLNPDEQRKLKTVGIYRFVLPVSLLFLKKLNADKLNFLDGRRKKDVNKTFWLKKKKLVCIASYSPSLISFVQKNAFFHKILAIVKEIRS